MRWIAVAAFGLALAMSSAASAQRPDRYVDPPIVRSFNWFALWAATISGPIAARTAATACA